jgi:transcriptional regulator with XRE-family HTH domain
MGTTQMMLGIKLIELHLEHGIGLKIAARRHQLHWSQAKLARAIGCSRQTIAAYESGESSIPAARLKRISNALRVDDNFVGSKQQSSPAALKGNTDEPDQLQIEIGAQVDPEIVRHREDADADRDRGAISGRTRYPEAHATRRAERRLRPRT